MNTSSFKRRNFNWTLLLHFYTRFFKYIMQYKFVYYLPILFNIYCSWFRKNSTFYSYHVLGKKRILSVQRVEIKNSNYLASRVVDLYFKTYTMCILEYHWHSGTLYCCNLVCSERGNVLLCSLLTFV